MDHQKHIDKYYNSARNSSKPETGEHTEYADAPSLEEFLCEENEQLRKAGSNLAEAALRVGREYDGIHRLMLAVSEWAKALADEGGRGQEYGPSPEVKEDKRKTVDVWVTRDEKDGNDPDELYVHAKKPELNSDGEWDAAVDCMAVPDLQHGECKRLRLDLGQDQQKNEKEPGDESRATSDEILDCPFCGTPFNKNSIKRYWLCGEVYVHYECPGCHVITPKLRCGGFLQDWWNQRDGTTTEYAPSPEVKDDKRKTVDVWVTRDASYGDDPDMLFVHAKKPELGKHNKGQWSAGVMCNAVPDLKHGECKRLRLDLEEDQQGNSEKDR